MNSRLALIHRRQQLLRLSVEAQRRAFAEIGERWRLPLAVGDAGIAAARSLRRHPVLLGVLAAVAVNVPRSRARRWTGLAVAFWQGYKTLLAARSRSSG